ncbi:hypothetical protein VNO78_19949 [Psophocarpus tetragonolobus]|uniref:Uncharacterized protein n=1 Tax=Psophocarpus tetragonolobus TaxID=3891 RepID=A0AAN9SCH3_PSOTE
MCLNFHHHYHKSFALTIYDHCLGFLPPLIALLCKKAQDSGAFPFSFYLRYAMHVAVQGDDYSLQMHKCIFTQNLRCA